MAVPAPRAGPPGQAVRVRRPRQVGEREGVLEGGDEEEQQYEGGEAKDGPSPADGPGRRRVGIGFAGGEMGACVAVPRVMLTE